MLVNSVSSHDQSQDILVELLPGELGRFVRLFSRRLQAPVSLSSGYDKGEPFVIVGIDHTFFTYFRQDGTYFEAGILSGHWPTDEAFYREQVEGKSFLDVATHMIVAYKDYQIEQVQRRAEEAIAGEYLRPEEDRINDGSFVAYVKDPDKGAIIEKEE